MAKRKQSKIQCYYETPEGVRCAFDADPKYSFFCGKYHKELYQKAEYGDVKTFGKITESYLRSRVERMRKIARDSKGGDENVESKKIDDSGSGAIA